MVQEPAIRGRAGCHHGSGLESPLGVIAGGLFLGIVESLTSLYIGPTYTDVASFGILVLVLIVRPTGLLGRTA